MVQIDALGFVRRLKAAGASEELAEAIAEGLRSATVGDVATKGDLAEMKAELLKWMFAQFLGQVGVIVALFLLLRSG